MICVGIDIAKDKHDCCILDSDGMVRADCFTIPNTNHFDTSGVFLSMLFRTTDFFALVTSF